MNRHASQEDFWPRESVLLATYLAKKLTLEIKSVQKLAM